MLRLTAALSLAGVVSASFENNLAYLSPSRRHASLAVPISHVQKRQTGSLYTAAEVNFTHGIASGDPYANSVILWTRLSPTTENVASDIVPEGVVPIYGDEGAPPSSRAACVEYRIGTDEALTQVVDSGRAYTSSEVDWTVKFEATNLQPFTTYHYRFNVCSSSKSSPLGRTKTIPSKTQSVPRNIRLAVYSCSNYPEGYFNAYSAVNAKDSADYILHLGDYIYEYKASSTDLRKPLPDRETYTLYDYRKRTATYRLDPDLSLSHQKFPWIPVWDDHEVADNSYKDGSKNSNGEEFRLRKQAAVRSYFEWMPIRQVSMDDSLRIWRSFSLGDLFDLIMLDTRQYNRDVTVLGGSLGGLIGGNKKEVKEQADWVNRTIMGFNQEAWFYDQLKQSSDRQARWRLVGNQVIFSRVTIGVFNDEPFNRDQWDGYLANRDRVYQTLVENKINNTVMLSGDSHAAWVSDMAWSGKNGGYDEKTGAGAVGVELAGSAVSSSSPLTGIVPRWITDPISKLLINKNPELQWQDLYYRGYFEMDIGYDAIEAQFFGIPDLKKRSTEEIKIAKFLIRDGENKLARNPTVGGGVAYAGALKNGKVQ
ncbi:PhoD-like phosphatase-domain-containing protein [Apiosordaria backusii]|uniref:PhoD-like phosphatase-domain-containing protein n=1 Tax=Apiosordaria backusii TaxID=314023 RepID=A0AA40EM00_9PEZI|nr:PhoD-like phosphatase-domain-containing protein [Apiosordaria backusii]